MRGLIKLVPLSYVKNMKMSFKKDLYNNATFEEFNISIGEDGKIIVTNNGIIIPTNKRKETLLRIAKRLKVGGTDKWNTDKLGLHIIIILNKEQTIMAIRDVMNQLLSKFNNNPNEPLVSYTYTQQRFMINQIFQKTSGKNYNQSSVMLRLIVIDSLYSTNAQYCYFSIEEMAKAIIMLGTEEEAAIYFYGLVTGGKDKRHLFSNRYGIRKNLEKGSKQMSLMSKYAYYALLQSPQQYTLGFPIYDRLALNMYPIVYDRLALSKNSINNSDDNICIEDYIKALNKLRKVIFSIEKDKLFKDYQQYDILDAYLWRMGKLDGGNYSLLLDRNDYQRFIKNLGLNNSTKDSQNDEASTSSKENSFHTFNENVRIKTSELKLSKIIKGLNDSEHIKVLIEHWQKYYA